MRHVVVVELFLFEPLVISAYYGLTMGTGSVPNPARSPPLILTAPSPRNNFAQLADSRYKYPPPDRPFLQVEGFQFCHCLNNATFFTDLVLDLPSGPARLSQNNTAEFALLLDYTARKMLEQWDRKWYQREVTITPEYREDFAAYLILIHDKPENVEALIDALLSPDDSVFIYLHIDAENFEATVPYTREILQNVQARKNVALMETRFAITWGHISMLWAEIRGFFDLLDMISFDYVINLSGSDYPLKTATVIYDHLQRRPGGNWLYWNDGGGQLNWRLESMFHCLGGSEENCRWAQTGWEFRSWKSLEDLFQHKYKGSQWLILHYDAVQYLRHSERAKLLLMWAEHTLCPDEMILPILFAASPFVNKTYQDPKRLLHWNGGQHPRTWTIREKWDIEYWQRYFFWIRKVDVVQDKELKALLDGIRETGEMWDGAVADFKWGVVPVDK